MRTPDTCISTCLCVSRYLYLCISTCVDTCTHMCMRADTCMQTDTWLYASTAVCLSNGTLTWLKALRMACWVVPVTCSTSSVIARAGTTSTCGFFYLDLGVSVCRLCAALVRCVPTSWTVPTGRKALKIWDDSGAGGKKVQYRPSPRDRKPPI